MRSGLSTLVYRVLIIAVLLSSSSYLVKEIPISGYPPQVWGVDTVTMELSTGSRPNLETSAPVYGVTVSVPLVAAVQQALEQLGNIRTSRSRFDALRTTAITTAGQDGHNIISFNDTTTAIGSATVALTITTIDNSSGAFQVREADVLLNPNVAFTTVPFSKTRLTFTSLTGAPKTDEAVFPVLGVLTHELEHVWGLGHTASLQATVFPVTIPAEDFPNNYRGYLDIDDVQGLSYLYKPSWLDTYTGSISGTVTFAGGGALAKGYISAYEVNSGIVVASGFTRGNGSYLLTGLPTGSYSLCLDPIDEPYLDGYFDGSGSWAGVTASVFAPICYADIGNRVSVVAGLTTTKNITGVPAAAPAVNLITANGRPRSASGASGWLLNSGSNAGIVGLPTPGSTNGLNWNDSGVVLQTAEDHAPGTFTVTCSDPSITIASFNSGASDTLRTFFFVMSVPTSTAPGTRHLFFNATGTNAGFGMLSGGIRIIGGNGDADLNGTTDATDLALGQGCLVGNYANTEIPRTRPPVAGSINSFTNLDADQNGLIDARDMVYIAMRANGSLPQKYAFLPPLPWIP